MGLSTFGARKPLDWGSDNWMEVGAIMGDSNLSRGGRGFVHRAVLTSDRTTHVVIPFLSPDVGSSFAFQFSQLQIVIYLTLI